MQQAQENWSRILQTGDHAIDATCGNGKDTLALAQILFSRGETSCILGIDIQAEALQRTEKLLSSHLTPEQLKRIFLFEQSHATFPPQAYQLPIRLIIYNLGYLPRGNKALTTCAESTLQSIQAALPLLLSGGALSLVFYPGHPEGLREQAILTPFIEGLDPRHWQRSWYAPSPHAHAPVHLFLEKWC